jgi:DNA polymerase III alpha subunit
MATSNRVIYIGQGSQTTIIVSYCLVICVICPRDLDLYFERSLNLNRKVRPKLAGVRKKQDTSLEYIFDRYGRNCL